MPPDTPAYRLLVVCVGNVCRSPLAERLLIDRLPRARYVVSSAGVAAPVGAPMDPEAAAELEARGGSASGFAARQLTSSLVAAADLVLTATLEVRSRVLEDNPVALRRTFTLLEAAALAQRPESGDWTDLSAAVRRASGERSRVAGQPLDVPDPYGQGAEAHAAAAAAIDDAVRRLAEVLGRP